MKALSVLLAAIAIGATVLAGIVYANLWDDYKDSPDST